MAPDDNVKPPHVSKSMRDLTPPERPSDLTAEASGLINKCAKRRAEEGRDLDSTEILECLNKGDCKAGRGDAVITLPMVLFVLAERSNPSASSPRDLHGRR
jgi:hypothetical protein